MLLPKGKKDKYDVEVNTCCWDFLYYLLIFVIIAICTGLVLGVSYETNVQFMLSLLVFVLAIFVGYKVIWNVTPALHTPLMSVTNAISGIIVVGSMLQLHGVKSAWEPSAILGLVACFLASINVVGGFMVTQRMLAMFVKL